MMAKKKTRVGIFQPALRVRVGHRWEFQTCTCPAGNPPRQTHGYAQPVIFLVNPGYVGKTFDDAALCEIINAISNGRDCLLEIVKIGRAHV